MKERDALSVWTLKTKTFFFRFNLTNVNISLSNLKSTAAVVTEIVYLKDCQCGLFLVFSVHHEGGLVSFPLPKPLADDDWTENSIHVIRTYYMSSKKDAVSRQSSQHHSP